MDRMRKFCKLTGTTSELQRIHPCSVLCGALNVQSLHAHQLDFDADFVVQAHDSIFLCETRSQTSDDICARNTTTALDDGHAWAYVWNHEDCTPSTRPSHGSAMLYKPDVLTLLKEVCLKYDHVCEVVGCTFSDRNDVVWHMCGVYRSPHADLRATLIQISKVL